MTTLISPFSSPPITSCRSNRLWPCQSNTLVESAELDLSNSSDHCWSKEVGATIKVIVGTIFFWSLRRRVPSALSSFSWVDLLLLSASSSSDGGLECIKADIMIVLPIPTICSSDGMRETRRPQSLTFCSIAFKKLLSSSSTQRRRFTAYHR